MTARRALAPAGLAAALILTATLAGSPVWGAFSAKTTNSSSSITAIDDLTAPSTSARAIGKGEGGVAGFVRPGGSYRLYAQATDTGNPASGVGAVRANLSSLTSGQTSASLSSGTFSFDSVSYNRRSSSLTVGSGLSNGSYSYSITLEDEDENSATESGYTVTVDGTAPSASNVQTTNKSGGTAGRPEQGDTVVLTFSEPPEPNAILSGWSGSSTSVTVRIDDNATSGNDRLQVYNSANSSQLPLGSVNLGRTDYVSTSRTFGASGTASTMVLSSSALTITFGTQSGAGTTAASTGSMVWSPSSTATDRAGNAMGTSSLTETGTADKDF